MTSSAPRNSMCVIIGMAIIATASNALIATVPAYGTQVVPTDVQYYNDDIEQGGRPQACVVTAPNGQGSRDRGAQLDPIACRRSDRISGCFAAVHESAFGTKRISRCAHPMSLLGVKRT